VGKEKGESQRKRKINEKGDVTEKKGRQLQVKGRGERTSNIGGPSDWRSIGK